MVSIWSASIRNIYIDKRMERRKCCKMVYGESLQFLWNDRFAWKLVESWKLNEKLIVFQVKKLGK